MMSTTRMWWLGFALALTAALGCSGEDDAAVDGGPGGGGGDMGGGGDRCVEGVRYCEGFDEFTCVDGAYVPSNGGSCVPDVCEGDSCEDACLAAARNRSYLGCEYWAVDLDNAIEVAQPVADGGGCPQGTSRRDDLYVCVANTRSAWLCEVDRTCSRGLACEQSPVCVYDAQNSPFSIVVANPSTDAAVTVGLEGPGGESHFEQVPAGGVAKIVPGELGFADASIDHTSQGRRAYKLTSTEPIVAYQFNPLDNVGVFSNDGSLLIPRHAYDTVYYVMTQPTRDRDPIHDYSGYVSIVASEEGPTTVRVRAAVPVRAGPDLPSFEAGLAHEFTLQQGDVLNLEAIDEGDLTGTQIEAVDGVTPFGVFVGHEAIALSDLEPAPCCADHVEEQLFPASTWGLRFAIARTEPRTELRRQVQAPDMLRLMALEPDTEIRLDPPARDRAQNDRPICRVGTAQYCDVFIDEDTLVLADKPILVGHFLVSTGGGDGAGNPVGDPAMAFAAPFEQYREQYPFLAPEEYDEQYASIVAPIGSTVTLDGRPIDAALTPFSAGTFMGGRIPIAPGQHLLECAGSCGLLVYGYSPAVSYLFAGGLDLRQITVP